jgi:hypothetical protein
MNSIFKILFKNSPTNQSHQNIKNLPELVRKINKNELTSYQGSGEAFINVNDPLHNRINVEEPDYIIEYNKELSFLQKYFTNKNKRILAKYFHSLRYQKEIKRPNAHLRQMYFGLIVRQNVHVVMLLIVFISYCLGYFWSRMKYDIYTRRYLYVNFFNIIMLHEFLDYHLNNLIESFENYFPREFSEKDYEYILYKKLTNYVIKRRIKKKIEVVLGEDPQVFEIDEMLKKINK